MRAGSRLFALLALLLAAPARAAAPPPIDPAALDRLLAASHFQGEAIVGRGDGIAYRRVLGTIAPGGAPLTPGLRWRWASLTKQLTALIVMQEVAAGTIDLDAPVASYWPEWRAPHAHAITIRHLLRHQSGLADPAEDTPDKDGIPAFYRATGAAADPAAHAAGFCADRPRGPPPAAFHYDNCDYLVLGRVLERVTGKSFPTLIADRLAMPLGLTDIGVYRWDAAEPPGVVGYDARGLREPGVNLGVYGAAGGVYGSPESLWRIDRALLRSELLDRIATAAMWAGDPALGYAALGAWSFPAPLKGCPDPVRLIERRGEIGGIEIRNILLPDSGTALILFSNRADPGFGEIWQQQGLAYDLLATIACPAAASLPSVDRGVPSVEPSPPPVGSPSTAAGRPPT